MKNLSKYNSPENIGTIHWFKTLTGRAKHIGEFINKNIENKNINYDNYYSDLMMRYGKELENIMSDLIEW